MVKCYWIVLANKLVLALQKVYFKLCDDNLSNLEKNGYLFTLYKVLKKTLNYSSKDQGRRSLYGFGSGSWGLSEKLDFLM